MDLQKEINELTEMLKQQRDEIGVQIHLAGMEAKDEWEKTEKNWGKFIDQFDIINDATKETTSELIHTTKVIGDELLDTYKRISNRLNK